LTCPSEYVIIISAIVTDLGRKVGDLVSRNALAEIKGNLENYLGYRILLKANRGRQKTVVREGILEKTYPHIFIVRLDETKYPVKRVSYSYADVLTKTVQLTVYPPTGGELKIAC
jgi:uncharacterized protein Veg